jgi:hypothetical protein
VSWNKTSIPVWATHIPETPPQTNKNAKVKVNMRGISITKTLFTIVTHQCISLVAAGTDIITVNVLKSILVVWDSPTIYMWWPQTKKPKNAIVYIEYIKLALAETRFLKKKDIIVLVKPKIGIRIMYTSGCPKNQNICWNSTASPPPE